MADDPLGSLLGKALNSIAPPNVAAGCRRIDAADLDDLWPIERAAISNAVAKRRHEFATGRALLRQLLDSKVAIPTLPDRKPDLPVGVTASLAHDERFAVAVVATDPGVTALGLDIEPTDRLDPDVATLIVRPDEGEIDPHLAFTLKEAAYKAWSMAGGRVLEHHDIRLSVANPTFEAEVVDDGARIQGSYTKAANHWLALVVVTSDAVSNPDLG